MALNGKTTLRFDADEYERYCDTAINKHGKHPMRLLRELMTAVADGRVRITPTEEQRSEIEKTKGLYNVD